MNFSWTKSHRKGFLSWFGISRIDVARVSAFYERAISNVLSRKNNDFPTVYITKMNKQTLHKITNFFKIKWTLDQFYGCSTIALEFLVDQFFLIKKAIVELVNEEVDPFQPGVAFHIEMSHLICNAKQMAAFYMKLTTGLK